MVTPDTLPDPLFPAGSIIGRYRLVRPLGEGGMATVYEAVHTGLGKRVAMKILRPEATRLPDARARFLREGQTAASIRHPHVAEVFDVGLDQGVLYLVMEYLEGENLYEHLYRVGLLPTERCVDLLLPVCAALAAAHEQGIVHRDVKPENIFLARARHGALQPKLLDFGISRVSLPGGDRLTATATLLGTPHYMSPEQAQEGGCVDARTDQYAFGVTLYECSTGQRPFEGEDLYPLLHSIVQGNARPPRAVRPELSPAFEAVVQRAMARDATARFPSMQSLGGALLPFASAAARSLWSPVFAAPLGPAPATGRTPPGPTTLAGRAPLPGLSGVRPRSRGWPFMAGCAVALVLVGAALVAAARHPTPPPRTPVRVVSPGPLASARAPPPGLPSVVGSGSPAPRPHRGRASPSAHPAGPPRVPRPATPEHGPNRAPIVE